MANGGTIRFGVGFDVDTTSLQNVRTQLSELTKMSLSPSFKEEFKGTSEELNKITTTLRTVNQLYDEAFDSTTGTVNTEKFTAALNKQELTIRDISETYSKMGAQGTKAFNSLYSQLTKTNLKFKETNNFLTKMGETLTNTIKWSISSSLINNFTNSIQQAWGYVQHLDTSLNDIRIVTGKTADEMADFAVKANEAASSLGAATTEYTEAALIYYQQGLSDDEANARAETTIKAANVTGQTGREVSEELTAVWNGYKVTAEETELYVDKLAAVAATTASDLEELSTGMSKVASAANNMGVDIDQLNAQLSTIISVTRQAPETAGTALKTIYARMEDLKINGEDEDGVKLGEVSSTLDEVGVHVMDTAGNLRDLGEVIEEVGNKWETWTNAQQSAIAQAIAGKRQYNNLLALFDNWDMYNSALETSANATGTLQNQQDIYMESTAAHIQKLKTEWEDLYDSLIDTDDINTIIDGATKIIDKFTSLIDIIGGGKTVLMGIIALLGQIPGISSAISNQFGGIISKSLNAKMNAQLWANYIDNVKANYSDVNKQAQSQYEILQQVEKYNSILTDEQKEQVINHGKIISSLEGEKQVLEQELSDVKQLAEETAKVIIDQDPETGEDTGAYNLLNGDSQFYSVSGQKTDYEDMFDAQEQAIQDADIALEDYINSIETYIEKQEEIPKAEEYTDIYGQSIGNSALEYEQQIETVKESVQDLQSSLSKPLQLLEKTAPQEFEKVNKALKETTELIQSGETDSEKIRESYEKLRTAATQAFEQAGVKITDFREKLGSLGPKIAETSQKLTEAKQKFEEFLNDLASNAIGEGITKITGSLAGFAYGVQSIQSLGSIWNNADVGLGQKLLSTITSLSLALPMLSSSFTKIKEGLTSLNIGLSGSITQLLKYGSTEELISLAQANFSRLTQEQITELGLSEVEWDRETAAVVLDTLAKEGNIGTTTTLGNLLKTKLLTGLESAKTGFKTLATAIGLSTGALTALLVVIGLVAAAFIGYYNHLKSVREAEANAAEARAEAAKEYTDSLEEEKTKVDELVSSYKSLKEQYEDHSISLQTLREEVYDLAIQYGYEDLALQALTGSYESLTKAMAEYQTQANKELIEAQNKEKDSLKDKIGSSIWRDADETARDEIVTYELDENGNSIAKQTKTLDLKGFGVRNNDDEKALAKGLEDLGINVYENGHIDYEQFVEVLTENRDELQAVINKSSSEAAAQLQEYIDNSSADLDRYEELTESVLTEEEQNRGLILEQSDVKSYEDAQKAYKEYMQTATEVDGLTWEEAQAQFIKYASTMDNTFMQEEAKRQLLKDKMESEYLAAAKANNIDTSDWDVHEQTEQFIDELLKSGFSLDDISLITEEQWHKLYLGELNLEDIKTEIEEETRQNLEQIRNDFLNNDVGQFNIDLNSVISDMVSGDLSADDETYVALSEQLESIKEAFPELTDEATIFLQEGLIGTEAWAQAAYSLQDAFDQLELERLNDNFKDELEDITPELDTSTFKTQMEELLDADYEISVKIYSDGIEEFENAEAALDDIDEMASKIGDDFIVAADDIRELNNTFPGILDGMTYLADGTVQLNEEMVQSAMSMATEEELASTDATATKLENTAAELRAKADVYENMAELAYQAANDEIDAEDAKSDIIEQLDQLEADNDEAVSNTEIDNSNLVADVSASDAQTLANNWTQAYQEAAEAANSWADVALAAQDAVDSGDSSKKSTFNVNYKGSYSGSTASGATASSASLSSMDADDIDWNTLGDELSAQAEAYRSSANDLEGAAAELRAKSISSANTNADAADGTSDDDSSSSSSSEDEADTEEYLEREEDLYRAINEQLDDIESKLGRIDTIESHSWGADYLDTLEEENELLTAQLDLLETKKSTYESDLSSQQATLSSYGVTFSEDGSVMTNAEDVLDSLYAEYNSMVDSYNSMSADAQDDYQDTLDSQKDYIDSIEDAIDSYEDAYSEYNSVLDDLLDTHYELIENAVNQFNTTIDVHLELDEAETEWNEFWYDVIQDVQDTDFSGLFEESIAKLTTLVGTTGNTSSSQVAELTTHLNDTITEVQKQIAGADIGGGDSIFGDDTALSKETLETYRDSLIDAVTSAKEEIDTMQENYLKALDDAKDKIDEQVEGWEAVGDHIEHNIELIQMVSGSKAFEPLNKQFEQQYQNNLNLIETQKTSQDYWKERMEYYEQMMATETEGSQMYQTYSDALEKASENYRSAVKDLDSAVKQALDDLEEWRKNQVSALEDTLDKALSSGMGLDDMQSEWDLILEKQGMYLDNVERALEMQDLEKDFSDVLDTLTTRNDLQQEFLKFQDEELSKLQNKNKLTQYDIDEVRARLEIRKAELALEEAQQNKSNLRLRRDSQGNYTYQYTANAEDTEDAEDGIVSAKREWYELVKKRQEEVAANAIDIGKRIKEAWSEYEQALEDEDQVRADNAKARYDELIAYEKDMMQEAEKAKQDFYQGTADFFADVNNNNILPIWDTTIEGMINKWSDGGETSFVGAVSKGITDLDNLQQDFSNKTNEILTTAGVNYENLVNNGIDPTTEALEDMNDTNDELNTSLEETNSLLDTLESELQDAIDAYDSLKDAAVSAIEEANEALNTLSNTVITSTTSATSTANSLAGTSSSNSSGGSSSSSSSGSGSGTSSTTGTVEYEFVKGDAVSGGTASSYTNGNSLSYSSLAYIRNKNTGEIVESGTVSSLASKKKKYGLATGGYTGEWTNGSEEGRLAFLHQKELVLNESDTENILNAVTAVRDLVGSQGSQNIDIEGISNSIIRSGYITAQVLAQVGTNMLQAIASMVNNNNSEVQNYRNMTVNADFSGVRSADAIYQALMDLDNYGSQQAYSSAPDMNVRY